MSKSAVLALVVGAVCSLGAWTTAEMVDNPTYKSWAAHGVGTKVYLTQDMKMQAMSMKHEMTQTLLEVTPEKAVIEIAVVMDMGGMKHEQKQKMEIAAQVEKGREYLPPDVKGTIKEVGNQKVEAAGKTYDCRVMEFTGESSQAKMTGKTWMCDQVPGNMVKNETHMTSPQEVTTSLTITKIETK